MRVLLSPPMFLQFVLNGKDRKEHLKSQDAALEGLWKKIQLTKLQVKESAWMITFC